MIFEQLHQLSSVLGKLSIQTLSIDNMRKVIQLHKDINSSIDEFKKLQSVLLESYGLVPDAKGLVSWANHENSKEINKKIDELFKLDFQLSAEMNFIAEEEFYQFCSHLTINDISLLETVLSNP